MSEDTLIRELSRKLADVDTRLVELNRALYGYPPLALTGKLQQLQDQAQHITDELGRVKELCESVIQDRRDEQSERRGIRRAINVTGITSFAGFLTTVTALIVIWLSVTGGAGGP